MVLLSILKTIYNVITLRLSFSKRYYNETLRMKDGLEFKIFRHMKLMKKKKVGQPAIFIVRFKFKKFSHETNIKASRIPIPLIAGFPGFMDKLWMIDWDTGYWQGIYQFENVEACLSRDCWNFKDNATCASEPSCTWEGWCDGEYNLSCWEYSNQGQGNCTANGCERLGNCYEQGCGSQRTSTECCGDSTCTENTDTNCAWETYGNCEEVGCWNYYDSATCLNATSRGCKWDSNGYCY